MAVYGYTVGDVNSSGTPAVGFDVYRFLIPAAPVGGGNGLIAPQLVTTLTGASFTGDNGEDLEGLGTNPTNQSITAVSEGPGLGRRVNFIDAGNPPPATQNLTGTSRQFSDSGADFLGNTLYNVQGESTAAGVKSRLYRVVNTTITQIGTDTEFADGLAISNAGATSWTAYASDFKTDDGDGVELYRVNLNGGSDFLTGLPSTGGIPLVNPNGTPFNVFAQNTDPDTPDDGFDSGLSFSPDGSKIYALLENGSLYQITDFADFLTDNSAVIQRLGIVNLPGRTSGAIEYEGLATINETAAGAPVVA